MALIADIVRSLTLKFVNQSEKKINNMQKQTDEETEEVQQSTFF
jgi:hypothetical protein